jgi:hypothetical protein
LEYLYEVREGDAITATGQLSVGHELESGDEIPFGQHIATVREVTFALSGPARVVLTLREQS